MEIENVIEELQYRDDLINLNEQDLLNKYGSDKDNAEYFLNMFYNTTNIGFPAVIYREFPKIRNVLNVINEKYTNGTELENIVNMLNNSLKNAELSRKGFSDVNDFDGQVFLSILTSLEITDCVGAIEYSTFNRNLLENTKKIKNAYDKNSYFPSNEEYDYMLYAAEKAGRRDDPMKELAILDLYYDKYPLLKLCHNKGILIALTNLYNKMKGDDKKEAADLTKNVIDFSLNYTPIGKPFNRNSYRKYAKKIVKKLDSEDIAIENKKGYSKVKKY